MCRSDFMQFDRLDRNGAVLLWTEEDRQQVDELLDPSDSDDDRKEQAQQEGLVVYTPWTEGGSRQQAHDFGTPPVTPGRV